MIPSTKILIADDESAIRILLTQIISADDYEVVTAVDGEDALRLACLEHFDLALIDLNMPRKDGIETILEMRVKRPATRIIAMCGGVDEGSRSYLPLAIKLGASRTLAKPLDAQEVLAAIEVEVGKPASHQITSLT